ncbi:cysteine hydrolase family protein [Undibacterium sp. Ren11W]|uniref:cysteine hydrolase family protein n=1 Tax=Undibacterium sp. Ren11W TaxID=3413045 RepID=UPI003BF366B0
MTTPTNLPPKRALIVIDVQNEYFSGGLISDYPKPATVLANIGLAMDAARAAGVPVLVVQHTAAPGAPIFQKGQPEWELHEVVKARRFDQLIEKTQDSVFAKTDFVAWLEERQIDTLSILGYMTQNCNAATIYQAARLGYTVEMLGDASGAVAYQNAVGSASAEEIHRVFSVVFHSNVAAVCSTAEWIELTHSGLPSPKSSVPASAFAARHLA